MGHPATGHGLSGAEIYKKITEDGRFTDSLGEGEATARDLHSRHMDISDELASLHRTVDEVWRGESAEAFKAKLDQIRNRSAETAAAVSPSSFSMSSQNGSFDRVYNEVEPVEGTIEEATGGDWRDYVSWTQLVDSKEEQREAWREKDAKNRQAYSAYATESGENQVRISQERDYPDPDKDSSGSSKSSGGTTAPSSVTQPGTTAPTASGGAGTTAPAGAAPAGSGGSTAAPGVGGTGAAGGGTAGSGGAAGGAGAGGRQGGVRLPDGSIRYPDGTIRRPDGSLVRPDGTVIPPSGTSASGVGAGRAAGDFGPTGSGAGGAGGMVAGGMAGAGGAAAGGGPGGAGAYSGQGQFGPTGSGGAAGAAGGQAGAGGGRAMGGGMMGAGGGRGGQGGGDEEHERKFVQDEQLDSGLPVMRDEHGEKEYDPVTGMVIIDGVIGE
ncbi:hypothetical protein SAMN06265360_10781 [Haloechinothrix alba]|uniref:PPE family protein n=1 Tax=Haloechinothrix alba TaxID=664784 RepID=A0A238WR20_9PSEU|nr:WXG100 family type VII secretion target [Haloechinothrix alba]SNR48704.1 hypothetical protein SAMN06265360_10781 [Haloechinothrix alba]